MTPSSWTIRLSIRWPAPGPAAGARPADERRRRSGARQARERAVAEERWRRPRPRPGAAAGSDHGGVTRGARAPGRGRHSTAPTGRAAPIEVDSRCTASKSTTFQSSVLSSPCAV